MRERKDGKDRSEAVFGEVGRVRRRGAVGAAKKLEGKNGGQTSQKDLRGGKGSTCAAHTVQDEWSNLNSDQCCKTSVYAFVSVCIQTTEGR